MKWRALLLLIVVVGATGCAYHVQLTAPSAAAPLPEREAAYARLRPMRLAETHVTFFDRMFARNQQFVDYVELADGTRVSMPEDILSIVAPESVAALAVQESLEARRTRRALRISAPFLKLAGGLTMIFAFTSDDTAVRRGLLIGGGITLGAGVGVRIGSHYVRQREEDGARRAFLALDEGLRAYLDVCQGGETYGVCGSPARESAWEQPTRGWESAP